jgi:NADPH:quinone reductase-like Zn-dependent oxidoreductase
MRTSSPLTPKLQVPQEPPTNPRNSLAGRWYATINNKGNNDAGDGKEEKKKDVPNYKNEMKETFTKNSNTLGDFVKHNHGVMNSFVRYDDIATKTAEDILLANPSISSGEDMLRAQMKYSQESEDTVELLKDAKRIGAAHGQFPSSARIGRSSNRTPERIKRNFSGRWTSQEPSRQEVEASNRKGDSVGNGPIFLSKRSLGHSLECELETPTITSSRDSTTKISRVLQPHADPQEVSSRDSSNYRSEELARKNSAASHEWEHNKQPIPRASQRLNFDRRPAETNMLPQIEQREGRHGLLYSESGGALDRYIHVQQQNESRNTSAHMSARKSMDESNFRRSKSHDRRWSSSAARGIHEQVREQSPVQGIVEDATDFERQHFENNERTQELYTQSAKYGPVRVTVDNEIYHSDDFERHLLPTVSQPLATRIEYYDEGSPVVQSAPQHHHPYVFSDIPNISLADAVSPHHAPPILKQNDAFHHSTHQYYDPKQNIEQQQLVSHPSLAQNLSDKGKEILAAIFPRVCTPIGLTNPDFPTIVGDDDTKSKLSIWSYLDPNDDLNYYDDDIDSIEGSSHDGRRQSDSRSSSRTSINPKHGHPREDKYSSHHKSDFAQITNARSGNSSRDTTTFSSSSREEKGDSHQRNVPGHGRTGRNRDLSARNNQSGTKESYSTQLDGRGTNDNAGWVVTQSDPSHPPSRANYSRNSTGGTDIRSRPQDETLSSRKGATDGFIHSRKHPQEIKSRSQSTGKGRRVDNYLSELDRFKSRHPREQLTSADNNRISRGGGGRARTRSEDRPRTRTTKVNTPSDFFDDPFATDFDDDVEYHSTIDSRDDNNNSVLPFGGGRSKIGIHDNNKIQQSNDRAGPDGFPIGMEDTMVDPENDYNNTSLAFCSFDARSKSRERGSRNDNSSDTLDVTRAFDDVQLQKKRDAVRERSKRNVEKLQRIGENRTDQTTDDHRRQRRHRDDRPMLHKEQDQSERPRAKSTERHPPPNRFHQPTLGKGVVGKRLDRSFDSEVVLATSSSASKKEGADPTQQHHSRESKLSSRDHPSSHPRSISGTSPSTKIAITAVLGKDDDDDDNNYNTNNYAEELDGHYMYVAYSRYGVDPLQVIQLCEHQSIPIPDIRKGEVLIRVEASTVSSTDCSIRRGEWSNHVLLDPYLIPGVAFVGRVLHGNNKNNNNGTTKRMERKKNHSKGSPFSFSTPIQVGDMVLSLVYSGSNARYLCSPKNQLVKIPHPINPNKAVCLAETYVTAFQALHHGQRGPVRYRDTSLKGKSVLIMGGYTALGKALIELCQASGVDYCYAVTTSTTTTTSSSSSQEPPKTKNDSKDGSRSSRPSHSTGTTTATTTTTTTTTNPKVVPSSSSASSASSSSSRRHYETLVRWGAIPLSTNPQDWLTLIGRQIDLLVTVHDPSEHSLTTNDRYQLSDDHWGALRKDGQVIVICTHPGSVKDPIQQYRAFASDASNPTTTTTTTITSRKKNGMSGPFDGGPSSHLRMGTCRPSHREKLCDRMVWYNVFDSCVGTDHNNNSNRGGGGTTTHLQTKKDVQHLLQLLEQDRIDPDVLETIPLAKVAKAQSLLGQKQLAGHIVCVPWLKQQQQQTTTTSTTHDDDDDKPPSRRR